ncbi:Hypothetical Protein FCC1311_106092, partial [Hondaea fermentalgiana]
NNNLEYVDFDDSASFATLDSLLDSDYLYMEIDSDHQNEAENETPMLDDSQEQDFSTPWAPAQNTAGYTPTLPMPSTVMQQHAADQAPDSSPSSPPLEQNAATHAPEDQVLPMCPSGPVYTDSVPMRPMVFLLQCDVDPESIEITLDFDPRFGQIYSETVQLDRVSPGLYQSSDQSGPGRVFTGRQYAQLHEKKLFLKAEGDLKRCPLQLKGITRRHLDEPSIMETDSDQEQHWHSAEGDENPLLHQENHFGFMESDAASPMAPPHIEQHATESGHYDTFGTHGG